MTADASTGAAANGFEIGRVRPGEQGAAAVTLARAFHNDPLFNFLLPDLLGQAYAVLAFMRSLLGDAGRFGEVWVARTDDTTRTARTTRTDDTARTARTARAGDTVAGVAGVAGVAAWLPPGSYPRGARREAINYVRDLGSVPRLGRRVAAGMRIDAATREAHRRVGEPHWYLALLGSDPLFQGRGAGSALLSPVLERCDAEGVPAYLETQKASNVPWYERHHFEVVDELRPRGCPHLWTMWRRPR